MHKSMSVETVKQYKLNNMNYCMNDSDKLLKSLIDLKNITHKGLQHCLHKQDSKGIFLVFQISSILFTHLASSWVSWGSWNDSLLYTVDRWVHCGEFAGDKTGMPVCKRLC